MRETARFKPSTLIGAEMLINPAEAMRDALAPDEFKVRKWDTSSLEAFKASRVAVLQYLFDQHCIYNTSTYMRVVGKESGRMVESIGWFRLAMLNQDTCTNAYRVHQNHDGTLSSGWGEKLPEELFLRILNALKYDRVEVYAKDRLGDHERLNLIHRSKFRELSDPEIRPFTGPPFPKA